MGKLIGSYCIIMFLVLVAVPQELAAQSYFAQFFNKSNTVGTFNKRKKSIRGKRYHCGEMDAYNKKRAYKKHKKARVSKMWSRKPTKVTGNNPVAQSNPVKNNPIKKATPPPAGNPANKTQPKAPTQEPPQKKSPSNDSPPPGSPPPLAEKSPVTPQNQDSLAVVKTKVPQFNRDALKKMTEDERRDTLLKKEPDIVLTPLQFVSNQDEFSVVNMDSFIQAMEYAQEGKVVLVEGHTDDLGSDAYNLDLSMKRAEKIRELLLSGGISDELISVIGYGETKPVVPNTSTENRSINRRIEFKIFSLPE